MIEKVSSDHLFDTEGVDGRKSVSGRVKEVVSEELLLSSLTSFDSR